MASNTPPYCDEFTRIPAPQDGAGSVALKVAGQVGACSAGRLHAAPEPLLAGGAAQVRLECADLVFIDSAGLGVLVAAAKRLRERGAVLTLRAVPVR